MKKKVMVWFSVVAMMALLISGATMAWFTDSKSATNTFTTGKVALTMTEAFVSPTAWAPGDVTSKDVTLKNDGNLAIYVRAKFVPKWNTKVGNDLTPNDLATSNVTYPLDANWVAITKKDKNNNDETWYYCKKIINPDNAVTMGLKVTLDGVSTNNDYQDKVFTLGVNAESVQAKNGAAASQW